MQDKNEWEINKLKEKIDDQRKEIRDINRDLKEFRDFKVETVERLKTIFNRLKDIEASNKWVSKTFFTLIAGGMVTAVGSLISYLSKMG